MTEQHVREGAPQEAHRWTLWAPSISRYWTSSSHGSWWWRPW